MPTEFGAGPPRDALVHLGDRNGTSPRPEEQAAKFSNVPRERFDYHAAIVLDDEAQAIAGVDAEVVANLPRDRDLSFRRQRRCRHRTSLHASHYLTSS